MHIVSNVVENLLPGKQLGIYSKLASQRYRQWRTKNPMEIIIHELEHRRRGPYSRYGYDFEGQLDSAITIRTMVVRNHTVSVQAGAGLVADSPEKEYERH